MSETSETQSASPSRPPRKWVNNSSQAADHMLSVAAAGAILGTTDWTRILAFLAKAKVPIREYPSPTGKTMREVRRGDLLAVVHQFEAFNTEWVAEARRRKSEAAKRYHESMRGYKTPSVAPQEEPSQADLLAQPDQLRRIEIAATAAEAQATANAKALAAIAGTLARLCRELGVKEEPGNEG